LLLLTLHPHTLSISSSLRPSILSFFIIPPPPTSTLFPYTTLFRSGCFSSPIARTQASVSFMIHSLSSNDCQLLLARVPPSAVARSEEHTSELQSHLNLVCRLLLEKKN